MKLVTINAPGGGRIGAKLTNGMVLDVSRSVRSGTLETWIPLTVSGVLQAGPDGMDLLRRLVDGIETASSSRLEQLHEKSALLPVDTSLLAPLPTPSLIVSAGMAYRSHLEEMKTAAPKNPSGFIKARSSIIGPEAPIFLPKQAPNMVDFEGEFSCVIGRRCYNVSPEEAMKSVVGYTIINDVSARDWVEAALGPKEPQAAAAGWRLNHLGKQYPTFCPMGPVFATKDEFKDPPDLALTTRLNGELMQSAQTGDLIFSIGETIAYFSRWYQFEPGDIVTTGSPAGVGYGREPKLFMKDGDVVSIEVEGLGVLRNPVRTLRNQEER